jgi:hypothetical protein
MPGICQKNNGSNKPPKIAAHPRSRSFNFSFSDPFSLVQARLFTKIK